MSAAPSVRLEGVTKSYGDVLAVNDVTATFGPGVTGLLGPNGAGKSTLIKLVTGMLSPSIGRVLLCDEPPTSSPHVMARVGLVPEQDPIYPGVSAFEVTSYLLRLHGLDRGDAASRARAALERVGLAAAMDRPVQGYSKGMRQRAKLAQALAHDPDVLVLDEPLNGLDPVGRREIVALVQALGAEGRCVVVSSHVLHEVEAMTRRVLLMAHGRVIAEGTVAEIRRDLSDRPLTVRVDTPSPREVARFAVGVEGVLSVDLSASDRVVVATRRPDDLFAAMAGAVLGQGLPVRSFHPTDEGLEAVFRYLTAGGA
ncbi:MAG: ABC transporter ATP-binding protein [Planctomycetes bacterium]|nr:ABC transporter ATP-binding protein [Planctomycetota bacterium]